MHFTSTQGARTTHDLFDRSRPRPGCWSPCACRLIAWRPLSTCSIAATPFRSSPATARTRRAGWTKNRSAHIQERVLKLRQLADRKQTILRSIEAQGKTTPELTAQIEAADTMKRLEDLYLPYKPKKQTLATAARGRGLEPLAKKSWPTIPRVAISTHAPLTSSIPIASSITSATCCWASAISWPK